MVARKLGIDEVRAEVMPDAKADVVAELQAQGRLVAMAGDGINDAPALARAQAGIAMGTGTDIAMETAAITLVKGDLRGIVRARALSQATMRNIRQNLFFAFFYNIIGVPRGGRNSVSIFRPALEPGHSQRGHDLQLGLGDCECTAAAKAQAMIDLHTHTNESDGSCTPLELVDRALAIGLEALAISDHDTFAGYDQAVEPARSYGLDLVCGIELSVRLDRAASHGPRAGVFSALAALAGVSRLGERVCLTTRRERNVRLVAKLQSMGVPIELSEVERIGRHVDRPAAFRARADPKRIRGRLRRCVSQVLRRIRLRHLWSGKARRLTRPPRKCPQRVDWPCWRIRFGWECRMPRPKRR